MRLIQLLLLSVLAVPLMAQWQGDTSDYSIYSDSLLLSAPSDVGGSASLYKNSNIIEDAQWEVNINMRFSPSSKNYACIYLVSDSYDFSGNGYYVKIGGNNDEVSLFRQDGSTQTKIIDGLDGRVDISNVEVKIKVARDNGLWILYADSAKTGYEKEGEVSDLTYRASSYFGVQSTYTMTRSEHFTYSQFSMTGSAFTDNVPPRLDSIVSLTQYQCLFYFNEEIEEGGTISYDGSPANEILVDGKLVKASFDTPFVRNDSSLIQFSVSDTSDNALSANVNVFYESFEVLFAEMLSEDKLRFSLNKPASAVLTSNITLEGMHPSSITFDNDLWSASFLKTISQREIVDLVIENILDDNGDTLLTYTDKMTYFEPLHLDVVINELMPDPNPKVSILPEVEYIELYNNNDFEIILTDWYFQKGNSAPYLIPFSRIEPNGYLLVGRKAAMDSYPEVANKAVVNDLPSLANNGMNLILRSEQGTVIDSLTYDLGWHNSYAKNGGYALSRIYSKGEGVKTNFQSSCSEDGGTPGQANCDQAPLLDSALVLTKYKARFYFNEGISVNSITYSGTAASDIILGINSVEAIFSSPFVERDTSIVTINVQDINGNELIREVKFFYIPFEVISVEMDDATHLSVLFNKTITTLNADDILLNNEPASSVSLDSGVYVATFVSPIENRTTVPLVISNVLDVNGNILLPYRNEITYFEASVLDIVINELMPDPNPKVSILPEVEYIELYNNNDFEIILTNWYFQKDSSTTYPFPFSRIEPNGYLLVGSEAAMDSFPEINNKIALPKSPSLSNSGMNLILRSEQGTVIDSLTYSSSWHNSNAKNGGYALSRIYSKEEAVETNFQSSCSEDGGTPGQANCDQVPLLDSSLVLTKYKARFYFNEGISVNSITYSGTAASDIIVGINSVEATFSSPFVERDTSIVTINVQDVNANVVTQEVKLYYTPFEVIFAEMDDATHLFVGFNKVITKLDADHILLNNEPASAVSLDSGRYVATFVNPIENRTTVSLEINNVLDINGDSLVTYYDNITYFNPEFGDLVFNEIMPDPSPVIANLPEAEYIELYNMADFSINLKGWTFVKEDKVYPFPTYQMGAGEYLIVTTGAALDTFSDTIKKIALSSFPSLSNSEMSLQLVSSKGTLIDFIDYENSWHEDAFKGAGGFSLERIDAYNPSQSNNWTSSCSVSGGTPGVENCVADDNPDSADPYVVNAYAKDNNWIMLDLSEPIFKSELLAVDYYLFSGNQTISFTVPLGDLAVTQQVLLKLSAPMENETVYALEVSGIQDLSANMMEASTHNVAICRLPVATEIAINEIMYAPFTGEAEYVELYNNTDRPFDLSQLKITKQEADGTWANGKLLSDSPRLLLPRAYLALSGDADILSDQYTIDDDAIILVSSMLSLGNESDNVGLLLSNATVIDALNYSNEWHSPLLNDTKGVALERLSAIVSTNVSTNWFSASSLHNYGTPGAENSQKKNELSIAEEIKVSPEVFTPNGDGDNDFTTIHIDDKYEGATVRVQIFNHRGIVVKELINNALITAYSDILWDGTDNDGARCSMGAYIIWVEIVTPLGEVVTKKMECVVSVRMR